MSDEHMTVNEALEVAQRIEHYEKPTAGERAAVVLAVEMGEMSAQLDELSARAIEQTHQAEKWHGRHLELEASSADELQQLRAELAEARRERAGMQHLAQKNRDEVKELRTELEWSQGDTSTEQARRGRDLVELERLRELFAVVDPVMKAYRKDGRLFTSLLVKLLDELSRVWPK